MDVGAGRRQPGSASVGADGGRTWRLRLSTEFTGERVISGQLDLGLWNEHISRYAFAARVRVSMDLYRRRPEMEAWGEY